MKIEFEDPDAWLVSYSDKDLVVFRQSLRDAGLGEEFVRRIGGRS